MGKQQSKEQEVIIAQNGAGNSASADQLVQHASTITYVLIAICVILTVGGAIWLLRYYKKCHTKWIDRGINAYELRRSMSVFRRQQQDAKFVPDVGNPPV